MSRFRSRVVTQSRHLLVLGVAAAALVPSAAVVVSGAGPSADLAQREAPRPAVALAAYATQALRTSRVPTAPVRAHVREVPLTPATESRGTTAVTSQARAAVSRSGGVTVTSVPQRVSGLGTVGLTWAHGAAVPRADLALSVRSRLHGAWGRWQTLPYVPGDGPDPGSAEARHARPGTDPMLVGRVDDVQVRATSPRDLPPDLTLAVISPGRETRAARERAAIDTSTLSGDGGADSLYGAADTAPIGSGATRSGGALTLAAGTFTPKPVIYSRAQWGADESIRDKPSLHYGEIQAGFVHHTVNANDYTRAQVPAIIRSIYAYHVLSRHYSDIAYNFLLDRFGRIWQGRAGVVERPIVSAGTGGFNDDSFSAATIGNFEIARPTEAVIQAYAALMAWKLSLHGVNAADTHQYVTSGWYQAINGHRDADPTACPGRYLYARIPDIRRLAAAAQKGWSGRQLPSDLASTPAPDLVVRRASDGEGFVIPTGGLIRFSAPAVAATGASSATQAIVTPDLTGDRRRDLLLRQPDGNLALHPGTTTGAFGATTRTITGFTGKDQVSAPGDLNGDGRNDLVARDPATGALVTFLQRSDGTFRRVALGTAWNGFDLITAAGDLTGDGHPDLVARDPAGSLWLLAGTGTGRFAARVQIPGRYARYDVVTGGGDLTHDGHGDLLVRSRATGSTFILPGLGDGTFAPRLGPVGAFGSRTPLLVGNVAGTADADVLTLDGDVVRMWVHAGTFDLGAPIDTGVSFAGADRLLAAGDWDRDGYGDVITRQAAGALVLWRGNGTGRLSRFGVIGSGFGSVSRLTAVGDLTGDGYPDLVGQPGGGVLTVYPGRGTAGFARGYPVYGSLKSGTVLGAGRWDTDGSPDVLLRTGGSLTLLHGNGPGWLQSPRPITADVSAYDWVVGVSDLTGTGHPDLLARQKGTGRLYALPGRTGGLGAPVYLGTGLSAYDLVG